MSLRLSIPLCLSLCLTLWQPPAPARAQGLASADAPEILPAEEQAAWNAVGRVNIAGFDRRQMCSGTLIAPALVLTAAHCVLDQRGAAAPAEDIVFVAGWRGGRAVADARGAALLLHPDFLPGLDAGEIRVHADLALLTLAEPLDGIAPLPVGSLPAGDPLTILGYRYDRPHIASRSSACTVTGLWPGLFETSCRVTFGTSGAPVLAELPTGWRTVGVVSAGSGTGTLAARPDAWGEARLD